MNELLPVVSVLMPVYNAAPYVKDAIESILTQTYTNFEFLIFNDGSTDSTSDIINSIKDERIKFYDYKINSGYVYHLNEGLRIAKGEYIARMDADDISLPKRFAEQVKLLHSKPKVGLCGTYYKMFGSSDQVLQLPIDDKNIREFMLMHSPMGHPTVMFRASIIRQYNLRYDKDYMPAEDYKLWYEFSKVSVLENIPEILLNYRVHPHQISSRQNDRQRYLTNSIRLIQLADNGFLLSKKEQEVYCKILDKNLFIRSVFELKAVVHVMKKIIRENDTLNKYDKQFLVNMFALEWHRIVCSINKFSPSFASHVFLEASYLSKYLSLNNKIKLLIKSIIFYNKNV